MYICTYMCKCIHTCLNIYTYVYIFTHVYICIYTHICTCVYVHTYVYIYIYVYVFKQMYIYVYIFTHMCVYAYVSVYFFCLCAPVFALLHLCVMSRCVLVHFSYFEGTVSLIGYLRCHSLYCCTASGSHLAHCCPILLDCFPLTFPFHTRYQHIYIYACISFICSVSVGYCLSLWFDAVMVVYSQQCVRRLVRV